MYVYSQIDIDSGSNRNKLTRFKRIIINNTMRDKYFKILYQSGLWFYVFEF